MVIIVDLPPQKPSSRGSRAKTVGIKNAPCSPAKLYRNPPRSLPTHAAEPNHDPANHLMISPLPGGGPLGGAYIVSPARGGGWYAYCGCAGWPCSSMPLCWP